MCNLEGSPMASESLFDTFFKMAFNTESLVSLLRQMLITIITLMTVCLAIYYVIKVMITWFRSRNTQVSHKRPQNERNTPEISLDHCCRHSSPMPRSRVNRQMTPLDIISSPFNPDWLELDSPHCPPVDRTSDLTLSRDPTNRLVPMGVNRNNFNKEYFTLIPCHLLNASLRARRDAETGNRSQDAASFTRGQVEQVDDECRHAEEGDEYMWDYQSDLAVDGSRRFTNSRPIQNILARSPLRINQQSPLSPTNSHMNRSAMHDLYIDDSISELYSEIVRERSFSFLNNSVNDYLTQLNS